VNLRLDSKIFLVCVWTIGLSETVASAQLGGNGSPISSSRYAVDLYQGPVTTSTRVIGMGGAYDAIAEGSEGNFVNPAAAAIRLPWSYTHLDYDIGAGVALPSTFRNSDFFNSGSDRTNLSTSGQNNFVFMDVEGDVQLGPWALGTAVALQQYGLSRDNNTSSASSNQKIQAQFAIGLLHLARSFVHGQLLFGAGIRYTGMNVLNQNTQIYNGQTLFTTQGIGYEFGWLWRPHDQAFRLGASVRSAVTTKAELGSNILADANGNRLLFPGTADQMYLPDEVALPWEWSLGFAAQLGSRPFNPRWTDPQDILSDIRQTVRNNELDRELRQKQLLNEIPADAPDGDKRRSQILAELKAERDKDQETLQQAAARTRKLLKERERKLGRWYLLMATSLKVSGPVKNAVGVESFLQRVTDHSGDRVVASPHLGVESEVIPRWLKLRAGLYGEPTRFSNNRAVPRGHSTFGFESKLFSWSVFGLYDSDTQWRVQAALDMSQRYFAWSASFGVWH
jgi:hypothetical protein